MIVYPPAHLVKSYYTQAIEWKGLFVIAGPQVSQLALYTAAETVFNMLRHRLDIVERLGDAGGRFGIAPVGGVAVDLPEFAWLKGINTGDGRDYSTIVGLGGVIGNPISSSNVDNILKLPSDTYLGLQNIMLHEAAHLIENVGFDQQLRLQLDRAYDSAMSAGLWAGSYAASNSDEYFAVLSEAYFGHRREDTVMTSINTREELRVYDPLGFELARAVYGDDTWNDGDWVGTDGNDQIVGSNLDDYIVAFGGDDKISPGGGADTVIAGEGLDVVVIALERALTVITDIGGWLKVQSGQLVKDLLGVERIHFADGVLAFDIEGNAGQAYRLYQAAFERTPDNEGLNYWIGRLDDGDTTLTAVADSFLNSPEFVRTYGTEQTVSNARFVELLYTHTLGREYDQEGYSYWVGKLDASETNRRDLLAFFSESNENKSKVADTIDDGIWLT